MTDNLHKDVARAREAELLLDNALLKESFAKLRTDYLAAWEGSNVRDTDARERLWQALQIVGLVQSHLKQVMSDGRLARAELGRLATIGEKNKRFGVV